MDGLLGAPPSPPQSSIPPFLPVPPPRVAPSVFVSAVSALGMDGRLGVPSGSPRIPSSSIKGTSPLKTDEVFSPLSVCRLSSSLRSCGSSTSLSGDVGTHTNLDSDASLLPGKVLPCPTLAPTSVQGTDIVRKRELLRAPGSVSLQETVAGTLKASWSSVVKQGLPGDENALMPDESA